MLRSGALNEFEPLEPMSTYKWNRLMALAKAQQVAEIAVRGLRNHQYDTDIPLPTIDTEAVTGGASAALADTAGPSTLSNYFLNRRLAAIRRGEPHQIDASMDTLALLDIIVANTVAILSHGITMGGMLVLGKYLRTKGDKVDFVKLDTWLSRLHLRRMAQLQGSILVAVLDFEQEEIPFVQRIEPYALRLTLRSVGHSYVDAADEWHFRQGRTGFVRNNSALFRRNLRRSVRYFPYGPIETVSHYLRNFAKSLSEIEE